ncbi:histone H1.2-like [Phocoena sinus]|uniref:histone H1.2-like n=1 Tax=Phocoena sinus TaxID=42100 RepID=UPI0013C4397F|nr:histone H1.2-like [Phocoena sinus]
MDARQPPSRALHHPPSLRRSSGNVGVPGSAALVLTALPATQAVAPSAEMPKVAHQSPATRARHSLDRARHPPPPRLLPAPPITSLREKADESAEMGKSKRGGEGGYYGNRFKEKKGKKKPPARHILVTPKGNCRGCRTRARDRARRLSRPGSLFLPSSAGPRLPAPRRAAAAAAAAEQPAGRASPPRRAAGSESASELAAACQPRRRAAGGAVSQQRSWNLKRQARRGVRAPARERSTLDAHRLRPGRVARAGPARKVSYGDSGRSA